MTTLRLIALLALLAAPIALAPEGGVAAAQPLEEGAFAQSRSDVAPDPDILFGRLKNGMGYVVVKNDTPHGQVAVRLRVGSGSLEETSNEQGLAHVLEHMAFKGSLHVPEGEMIKLLERHGLAFGPDTNAFTSWTETVFMLDLPHSDLETVDLGLMLMRETAGALTLTASALQPERGVVLSEERLRDTPDYEAAVKRFHFLMPGQLAADRFPIGKAEVIKSAPASLVRGYYERNYRPDRTTLVVVGDLAPADVERKIARLFGDWTPVAPPPTTPDLGAPAVRGPASTLIVQPGAHEAVSIDWVRPFDPSVESEAKDRAALIEEVASGVVQRRLERLAQSKAPPFVSAGLQVSDVFRSGRFTSLTVTPQKGGWAEALSAALDTVRQAAAFGVSKSEIDRELQELRARTESAAKGAATRRSPDIASEIVRALDEREVLTSPSQDLARFENTARTMDTAAVNASLRTMISGSGPLVSLVLNTAPAGGEAALTAALSADLARQIAAGVAVQAASWPYASFGAAGTVTGRKTVKDLGVEEVRFANGVRLIIKPTTFHKDEVLVKVRLGHGRVDLPKDAATEAWASPALILGGLGKITFEDMRGALADRIFGAGGGFGDDAFDLSGATRPADLNVQLQVLAAYVSDPAFRPEAFARVKNGLATQIAQLGATPQGVFARDVGLLEHGGDLRWATPTMAQVQGASLESLKSLLQPILSTYDLEVDVAGDVEVEAVIAATAATFGALPVRTAQAAAPGGLAVKGPTVGAPPIRLTHSGRADQAIAFEAWPTSGFFADPQRARALNIAADVLQLRLIDEVRVAQGATYSPSAGSSPSLVFPGFGLVAASVEIPPTKIEGFFKTVEGLAKSLAAKGPTEDEMNRAVRPKIETLLKAQQTNEYWLEWLANADEDPKGLNAVRQSIEGYRALTPADVQKAAGAFVDANAFRLEVVAAKH